MKHQPRKHRKKLIIIGGFNIKTCKNNSVARNCENNLACFDTSTNTWSEVTVETGDSTLLQRCNFGSTAVTEDRIIIAGGVKYTEFGEKTKPQTLSIHEMVDLTLKEKETGEIVAEIKKIDVEMSPQLLSSFSMSSKGEHIHIFGGKQGAKKEPNGNIFIVNIVTKQLEIVKPPTFLSEKTKVWGSSSAWISDDTLMLMGGSLPPPGHGERSIFMYSSKPMDILTCGL